MGALVMLDIFDAGPAAILSSVLIVVGSFAAGLTLWTVQVRRERRDRTVELYLHYDCADMRQQRQRAWALLAREGAGCGSMRSFYSDDDDGMMRTHYPLFSVVSFFNLLDELIRQHQVDLDLTEKLFEQYRREWAIHARYLSAASIEDGVDAHWFRWVDRPFLTRRGDPVAR
jgi:hypothetical protein